MVVGVQHHGARGRDGSGTVRAVPLEFGDVEREETVATERRSKFGRDRAEVLADHRRPGARSLGDHHVVQLAGRLGDVRPVPGRVARRDPEQSVESEHMVDPQQSGDGEQMGQRLDQRTVPRPAHAVRNERSEPPILAGGNPRIGRGADMDAVRGQRRVPLGIEPVGVGTDRQVETESDTSIPEVAGHVPELFVRQPLHEPVVPFGTRGPAVERRAEVGEVDQPLGGPNESVVRSSAGERGR
jgi:hypothetical protein